MDESQKIPYDVTLSKVDVSYGVWGMYNFYKMQVSIGFCEILSTFYLGLQCIFLMGEEVCVGWGIGDVYFCVKI